MCSLPASHPGDIFHLILNLVPNYLILTDREGETERKREREIRGNDNDH